MAVIKSGTMRYARRYFTQRDFEVKNVTKEYWCRYSVVRRTRINQMPHGYLVIIHKYRRYEAISNGGIYIDIHGHVVRTHVENGNIYLQVYPSKKVTRYKVVRNGIKVLNIENPYKRCRPY